MDSQSEIFGFRLSDMNLTLYDLLCYRTYQVSKTCFILHVPLMLTHIFCLRLLLVFSSINGIIIIILDTQKVGKSRSNLLFYEEMSQLSYLKNLKN